MQKDLGSVPLSPFQEEIAVENFFAGGGRGELFSQIQEEIQNGSGVLTLTGEEGCGKTMICRMLGHETPAGSKTVFFPQTVESYEDVIQILALELGLERPSEVGHSVRETLSQITDHLKTESLHLSIIFDEAENIYLATLERIRKMLDQMIEAGCSAHMVFAGRNNFIENCEQLTICEFQHDAKLHFQIAPFSEDATFDYLRQCSERLADQGHVASFTDDIVRKIHVISKGNVRMINILAEESLKNQGDDTSFMVLLDSVSEDIDTVEHEGKKEKIVRLFRNYTFFLPWAGGIVFCGLILLFLLWPEEEVSQPEPQNLTDAQAAFIEKAPEVVYKETGDRKKDTSWKIPEPQQGDETVPVAVVEEPVKPEPQAVVQPKDEEPVLDVTEPPEVSETKEVVGTAETPDVVDTDGIDGVAEQETPSEIVAMSQSQNNAQATEVEAPDTEKEHSMTGKTIVQLRQVPPLKRSITSPPTIAKTTIKVQPRAEADDMLIARDTDSVDQVYQKRVLASTVWESHSKDQMYTVQLMVLTSADAEENLKRMLAKEEYRELANNFFIFQKGIGADVIFVFYGEYETITEARAAKDNFPESLREHQPYAIPIVEAVEKSKR